MTTSDSQEQATQGADAIALVTEWNEFKQLDLGEMPTPRLKSLMESLNALHVPTDDVIDIIKGIERNGKLHARLILE